METIARLSINQYTVRQWSIPQLLDGCASAGIPFVGLWRDKLAQTGLRETRNLLQATGVRVSSLCRGGFFPGSTAEQRSNILEANHRGIDEAAALATEVLVLVCGGIVNRDLDQSRKMVEEGIYRLLPYAAKAGVKLGIEPLHPMFAGDRSVIVSLREANRIAELFNSPYLGVVIDVYHVWWDPEVYSEISRAAGRIFGFHVNDWIVPLPDIVHGRGMMGDGVIKVRPLREAAEKAGYNGPIEVEVFNEKLWQMSGNDLLTLAKDRFLKFV